MVSQVLLTRHQGRGTAVTEHTPFQYFDLLRAASARELPQARHRSRRGILTSTWGHHFEIEFIAYSHRQQPVEQRISRCLTDEHHYCSSPA